MLISKPEEPRENLEPSAAETRIASLSSEVASLQSQLQQKEDAENQLVAEIRKLAAEPLREQRPPSPAEGPAAEVEALKKQHSQLERQLNAFKTESNAQVELLKLSISKLCGWEVTTHRVISESAVEGEEDAPSRRVYQIVLRPLYRVPEDPGELEARLDLNSLTENVRNREFCEYVKSRMWAKGSAAALNADAESAMVRVAFSGRLHNRWVGCDARWQRLFVSRKQVPVLLSVVLLDEHVAQMKLQGRVARRDADLKAFLDEQLDADVSSS